MRSWLRRKVGSWIGWAGLLVAVSAHAAVAPQEPAADVTAEPGGETASAVDAYVERYLATFPTRATAAGDHRYDRELENLTDVRLADWVFLNQRTVAALESHLAAAPELDLDAAAVLRHARRELFRHRTLRVSRRDPLYWTGIVGGMAAHLLVQDDLPFEERLRAVLCSAVHSWPPTTSVPVGFTNFTSRSGRVWPSASTPATSCAP